MTFARISGNDTVVCWDWVGLTFLCLAAFYKQKSRTEPTQTAARNWTTNMKAMLHARENNIFVLQSVYQKHYIFIELIFIKFIDYIEIALCLLYFKLSYSLEELKENTIRFFFILLSFVELITIFIICLHLFFKLMIILHRFVSLIYAMIDVQFLTFPRQNF